MLLGVAAWVVVSGEGAFTAGDAPRVFTSDAPGEGTRRDAGAPGAGVLTDGAPMVGMGEDVALVEEGALGARGACVTGDLGLKAACEDDALLCACGAMG